MAFSCKILKTLRLKNKMDIPAMSKSTGLTAQQIFCFEAGQSQPSAANLEKLADLFEVRIDDLFDPRAKEDKKA